MASRCESGSCGGCSSCGFEKARCIIENIPKPNIRREPYWGQGIDSAALSLSQKLTLVKKFLKERPTEQTDRGDTIQYVPTEEPCDCNPAGIFEETGKEIQHRTKITNGKLYKCMANCDGDCRWHYASRTIVRPTEPSYSFNPRNGSEAFEKSKSFPVKSNEKGTLCPEDLPKPILVCEGEFASWLSEEVYPDSENSQCEPMYGDYAGQRIRLWRVPSVAKLRHFSTDRDGVPSRHTPGNDERRGAFVYMVGLKVEGIKPPEKTPKPLNKNNPFSVMYVERTEQNKSVTSSGMLFETFVGQIGDEEFAVPKHGMNSPDYYDASLNENSGGTASNYRGGSREMTDPVYIFHSPDTHFRRPDTNASWCLFEGEVYGSGIRHGTQERGEKNRTFLLGRRGEKGTRQSLNMSRFRSVGDTPIVRTVKAFGYAEGNKIGSRTDRFTFPLLNTWRESSTYVELNGDKVPLQANIGDLKLIRPARVEGANTSYTDNSFLGDYQQQESTITGRTHYATFVRYIPRQYGSPVNQIYIPFGLEVTADSAYVGEENIGEEYSQEGYTVSGLCGDSFVNYHSFKRSSIVSDKVPDVISQLDDGPEVGGLLGIIGIGSLFRWIYRSLGLRNCGDLPEDGEQNYITQNGSIADRGGTSQYDDVYFPHLVKTNIFGWFNADENIKHRITREPDLHQIHSKRLKGWNYDSSFPKGADMDTSFLNRMKMRWDEVAGFKKLIKALWSIIFIWVVGIWILVKSFQFGSVMFVGFANNIGAIAAAVLAVGLAIAWIGFWIGSDWDDKFFYNILGIDLCFPDRRFSTTAFNASPYAMNLGRVVDYVDNWFEIDTTHSRINNVDITLGMSTTHNTLQCDSERDGRFYIGRPQDRGSHVDSWLNFDPTTYGDLPTELGAITKIFSMYGRMYVHTTDMLTTFQIRDGGGSEAIPLYGGVVEGYGGLNDPNAAYVTQYGYIFPDREARKWFIFSGSQLDAVSDRGVFHEFNEEMGLNLLEFFPDYELVDLKLDYGIGYSFGVDHEHDRLLFTKKDYQPLSADIKLRADNKSFELDGKTISLTDPKYFKNKSFTISYHVPTRTYTGYHWYVPCLYSWTRFNLYSYNEQGAWLHNVKGSFQNFYGQHFPFIIDFVVNDLQTGEAFKYKSSKYDVESYKWLSNGEKSDFIFSDKFFDKVMFWNRRALSGEVDIRTEELDIFEESKENSKIVKVDFKDMMYHMDGVHDRTLSSGEHLLLPNPGIGPEIPNTKILGGERPENITWCDTHLSNRLIFDDPKKEDIKIFLKRAVTVVDIE